MNVATGQTISIITNSAGSWDSGALIPGNYKTQVAAIGFSSVEVSTTVLIGNTATVNVNLQLGWENDVVEVKGSELAVNTEQAVQRVLDERQIENLPVNGRNFLDLAQLPALGSKPVSTRSVRGDVFTFTRDYSNYDPAVHGQVDSSVDNWESR